MIPIEMLETSWNTEVEIHKYDHGNHMNLVIYQQSLGTLVIFEVSKEDIDLLRCSTGIDNDLYHMLTEIQLTTRVALLMALEHTNER